MQGNAALLSGLLADEARGSDDLAPAGDPAVRAHLRFVAAALAANAAPAVAPALTDLATSLPELLAAREPRVEEHLQRIGEATAFELGLQFGERAGDDPGIRATVDRRMRVAAWTRVFLEALDEARVGADPIAADVLAWMSDRQPQLADTIFSMDRRAKMAERERGGPDAVASSEVVNRIGQAAMLHAHSRFLVEALSRYL